MTKPKTDNIEALKQARGELDEALRDYVGRLDGITNAEDRLQELTGEIEAMKESLDPMDDKQVLKLVIMERQVELLSAGAEVRPPSPGPLRQAVNNAAELARKVLQPKLELLKQRRLEQITANLGGVMHPERFLADDTAFQVAREFCICRWSSDADAVNAASEALSTLDTILESRTPFDQKPELANA